MPIERPNGEDVASYRGHETWSNERWAWEFLRRNNDFLRICRTLRQNPATESEEKAVAAQFGLVNFKSAAEPYAGRGFRRPKYRVLKVATWSRLQNEPAVRRPPVPRVGEMFVRIDLNFALENKSALGAQIRSIEKVAKDRLREFAQSRGIEPIGRRARRGDEATNLDLLRILDAKDATRTRRQIMEMVFRNRLDTPPASGASWEKFYDKAAARAEEMRKTGYLKLVIAGTAAQR